MRRLLRMVSTIAALGLLVLAGFVVTGHLRLQPVLTGSMAPHYPAGTLVAVSPVEAASLHVGDVIMFVPPKPFGTPTGGPVLHRIITVSTDAQGVLQIRTKGDANKAADPWILNGGRGGFTKLQASSVVAGRMLAMVRASASGPAVVLWPGLLLLWVVSRRRTVAPTIAYRPRHAA